MKALRLRLPTDLFVFLLLFTASCVTFRNVENIRPRLEKLESNVGFDRRQLDKLEPEDIILVTTHDAKRFYLVYKGTFDELLKGSVMRQPTTHGPIAVKDRFEMSIPVSEIRKIQIRKFNYLSGLVLPATIVVSLYTSIAISLANSEHYMHPVP